jgi:hypothetical protein
MLFDSKQKITLETNHSKDVKQNFEELAQKYRTISNTKTVHMGKRSLK